MICIHGKSDQCFVCQGLDRPFHSSDDCQACVNNRAFYASQELLNRRTQEVFVLREANAALNAAGDKMALFCEHERDCVRNSRHAGRPTLDGGYESQFGDKWYRTRPVDETPKCDCGADEALSDWQKARGQ